MRFFTFIIFLAVLGKAYGQAETSLSSPFALEFHPWLIVPEITGENTEAVADLGWGMSFAGVVQLDLTKSFKLETGLQIGYVFMQQTVTERDLQGAVLREVEVDAPSFHLGIPLFISVAPGNSGVYFKTGIRRIFSTAPLTSARIISRQIALGDGDIIFPAGDVNAPRSNTILEAGIGYRYSDHRGRDAYIELNIGRPTKPFLENAGPRNAAGRTNYLDTMTGYNLGLIFGYRFGR